MVTVIATMDWKSYHRLDVIYAFMDDLAAQYPYLCTVSVIGKSVEGRDLRVTILLSVTTVYSINVGAVYTYIFYKK